MTHTVSEFDDLYRRHAPAAFRRARRLLGTDADAQQVVHDVFLSLFERPEQYRAQSRMSAFLYGAVTHAALTRLRNHRTQARFEREKSYVALLLRMPQGLAAVAVYYYMDELTQDEIALVLGCSRSHAGDLLDRLTAWARAEEAAS